MERLASEFTRPAPPRTFPAGRARIKRGERPLISIVIPVRDAGEDLRRCMSAIAAQRTDADVEVIVIDSGSRDGSPEVAAELGASVYSIAPEDFNHGATRNLGATLARGNLLVFLSQDAYAEETDWLARLTAPLRTDENEVAGVYGRQIAHQEAKPPERFFLDFLYGPSPRVQRAAARAELSMETTLFSNVSSAIRRDVFERFPFVDDIIMSEDQEWSQRVLLAGYSVVYEPRAVVRHSHPYTVGQAFRRFFDSGVSADRAYLAGARPSQEVLRRAALRYAREEVAWLWRSGHRAWMPYAAVYEFAKFLGLQLGARHEHLPRALKLSFTATRAYWS